MKWFRNIITVLWKCWFIFLTTFFVLTIGVFWTFPFAISKKTFPVAYRGIRLWAMLIFYGSGFRLSYKSNKKLTPGQPYMFISNHTSILDIMVMAIIHKNHPIVFVGKEELAKLPIFGAIYKRICITVNRSDTKSRTGVFKKAKEKINQGSSIVIFPEGGIPDDTQIILNKFKDGAFTIAVATGLPICIYAFKGLKEMFRWSWTKGFPGKVEAELLDIIPTQGLSLHDKDKVKENCYSILFKKLNDA